MPRPHTDRPLRVTAYLVPGRKYDLSKPAAEAPRRERFGLGDAVSAVTKAVGIRECGGCAKRKEALNRLSDSIVDAVKGVLG